MRPGLKCSQFPVSLCVFWCKLTQVKKMVNNLIVLQNVFIISYSLWTVKSGVDAATAPSLYQYIRTNLKNLQAIGVMTIGAYGFDYSNGPNPDFVSLMKVHRSICQANDLPPESVMVSMGMSNDYDRAVRTLNTSTAESLHS